MGPVVIESVLSHYMDPDWVCPLLGKCPEVYETLDDEEAVQKIIEGKPDRGEWPEIGGKKKIRMVHISDLHIDKMYKEGTKTDCGDPICCRDGEGDAGYWGSLTACDLPQRTLQELLNFIKSDILKEDELLYVFWTGDNAPHDIWKQSTESNIEYTRTTTQMIKDTFREVPNIQFVPTMGNHEAFPVNNFDFQQKSHALYDAVSEIWREWIGDDAADHLKAHGYYKLEFGNWKIISFDSQVCNPGNYYLIKDPTDPAGFLDWAYHQLLESERKDQAVYFAAHIFTSLCLPRWGMRFKALIDRFSRIVRGQIYGHSHGEFFNLYRGYTRNETLNVAYISTSVTTDDFKNPSFRVFDIDDDTKIPLNYHQYRLDLAKAN